MPPSHQFEDLYADRTGYENLPLDIAALSQNKKINRYGYVIGDVGLLVPEDTLSEVLRKFIIYPVPNTRQWLRGLVNLRGNLVPVYDLSMLFGLMNTPVEYDSLLILDKGAEAVGILINKLPVVCDVNNWQQQDTVLCNIPGLEKFIKQAYRHDEKEWLSFDHREYFRSIKHDISL